MHAVLNGVVLCCVVCGAGYSRSVKELKESISGAQLDAGDLEQQAQHLRRQLATLADRIKRLESQVGVEGGGGGEGVCF